MEFKNIATEVKDLDEKKGIIEAYANVYHNEDSDKDISMPGSFTKTVTENRKRIRVLKDHNQTITLGVPLEIDPRDNYGLRTITQFNLQKEISRDMFTDIQLLKQHNLNAELSIGYGQTKRDQHDTRRILEYGWLGEYSFLSAWAANELAIVGDIKSIKSHYGVMEFLTKAYNLPYSDTRLIQIENILKSLSTEPGQDTTSGEEPIAQALKEANILLELKSFII
jgi:HK97 family phage prohead protease